MAEQLSAGQREPRAHLSLTREGWLCSWSCMSPQAEFLECNLAALLGSAVLLSTV